MKEKILYWEACGVLEESEMQNIVCVSCFCRFALGGAGNACGNGILVPLQGSACKMGALKS